MIGMHNHVLLQVCHRFGGQTMLARHLQISHSRLNKWINQGIRIPYEYAFAIEQLTEGQVTCQMLAPFCELLRPLPSAIVNRLSLLEMQVKKLEEKLNDSS
jgi:DNA-binding transcriptional regulator YdaS (Cro superfamily)